MLEVKLFLVVLTLVSLAFAGMGIRILLKRNGQFPETHVGHNKEMRKRGITCVKTWDKLEQKIARKAVDYSKLRLDESRLSDFET
jgi:hypothetical protein